MTVWAMWLLCVTAFTALSLSMDKHHEQVLGRALVAGQQWMGHIAGAALLLLALIVSLHQWSASVAVAAWLGTLTFAALPVVLLLTYAPRKLCAVAMVSAVTGLVMTGLRWSVA